MYFNYILNNNSITVNLIWTSSKISGLYRYLFFDFYLPKFQFIESDKTLTEYGYIMWKKLLLKAISLGKRTAFFNTIDNKEVDINSENINQLFETIIRNDSQNERFKIYK